MDYLVYLIPVACFAMAGALGHFLLRSAMAGAFAGLLIAQVIGAGLLYAAATTASGWDGLGYMIFLLGINVPTLLGSAIGGVVGHLRRAPIGA